MLEGQVVFAGTLGHYNTIMENPHFYLLDLATGDIRDYAYPDLYIGGLTVGQRLAAMAAAFTARR